MLHPLIMGFAFVVYSTPSVMLAEDLPYLEEFRHGQPELGTNESWEMNHVPVQVDSLLTTHRASIRQDNLRKEVLLPSGEIKIAVASSSIFACLVYQAFTVAKQMTL